MKRILFVLIIALCSGFMACAEKDNSTSVFPEPDPSYFYIREGISGVGEVVYNIDGNYIRKGISGVGEVVYNIDGNYIRKGISGVGEVVYNIDRKE